MGSGSILYLVIMTVYFNVYERCIACSDNVAENVTGILGGNIILTCNTTLYQCDYIVWDMQTDRRSSAVTPSGEQVNVGSSASYLSISGTRFLDDGHYRCWCFVKNQPKKICSVALKTICQARVLLSGRTNLYNSSSPSTHFVNVTAGSVITITCSEDASMEIECAINFLPVPSKNNAFAVLPEHDSCHLVCRLSSEDGSSCSVNFTLNVTVLENYSQSSTTSTRIWTTSSNTSATAHTTIPVVQQTKNDNAVPDKSGSLPVMLFIGIPIVVLVAILFIICFFMYSSRSKSTSRQKKTQNLGNESPDTNIPIGPTYATINKSSPGGDEDSAERGIPCTDEAYDEVGRDVKREPTQQDNAVKAEPSITKDYYSVVNTSNTKLESTDSGNKRDSVLYTEVNKDVKQAGTNAGASSPESSGCNPNVPDVSSDSPYDVLEQPESSEYDAVGVVSTSSALYAVVEKERKKE